MEFDDIRDLIEAFLAETEDVLIELETRLIVLEQEAEAGAVQLGVLQPLLRPLHTFKGNAGMLGMAAVSSLVHALEELIKADTPADRNFLAGLFDMLDALKQGLGAVREGADDAPGLAPWTDWMTAAAAGDVRAAPGAGSQMSGEQPESSAKSLPSFGLADDLLGSLDQGEGVSAPEAAGGAAAPSGSGAARTADDATERQGDVVLDATLRVSTDKLDQLQREVGDLILSYNALHDFLENEVLQHLDRVEQRAVLDRLDHLSARVRRVQGQTTRIRLLGLSAILRRVPRIVRDAAGKTGKRVQVVIDGEATEADKSVVDQLSEVLVHLVRNAVDHGIETPEERLAAGKPEQGLVIVRAQGRGDHVQIEIEDDGRGIDTAQIRKKVVARGLMSAEEAAAADEDTVLRWLFLSGFSTRDQATELSGRGVGLDVVERTVRALGGTVRLESTPGEGSRFELHVPISTAVAELLHVEVRGNVISVPLRRIIETRRFEAAALLHPAGEARYRWREELLPYVRLEQWLVDGAFVATEEEAAISGEGYVLILEESAGSICVPIRRIIGKSQAVLHPLRDRTLAHGPFSGATVLGNGYVSLILDAGRLRAFLQLSREEAGNG
ncbi:MAG: hypothetical protein D6761_03105 [Candidatus Dadabacteria bacterium]|nr:MAG: hypothetical protein D6761_03105 [Candidatus Dadabacteria bacterium]